MFNRINFKTAVAKAVRRSKSFLSAVLSSFCYGHETHPPGSNSHGRLTLHFAMNGNKRRAKPLKPTLPTAENRVKDIDPNQSRELFVSDLSILLCVFCVFAKLIFTG